jgi:acyl-CoA thioester hydrolase
MHETVQSCEIEIRVRYAECDRMGYVHHSKYFEYFEMARTELLRASGLRYRDMEDRGFLFVVAKAACRYHRPAAYDDLLRLKVRIERQTRARIDHAYELYRDGVLLCEATTTLACVGRDGRPIAIPDDLMPGGAGRCPPES